MRGSRGFAGGEYISIEEAQNKGLEQVTKFFAPESKVKTLDGELFFKDWIERERKRMSQNRICARVVSSNSMLALYTAKERRRLKLVELINEQDSREAINKVLSVAE